jgi:hypothetical protein
MKTTNNTIDAPNLKIEHVIHATPGVLLRLATSLDDFNNIALELVTLNGSGGRPINFGPAFYSVITDGTYAVLVNAEGCDYPRYRGPRLAIELLKTITPKAASAICGRKCVWPEDFTVETQEQLDDLSDAPYQIAE